METLSVIGPDIAKNVFQLHGVGEAGVAVERRVLRRSQMMAWFGALDPCLIGIEACDGALLGVGVAVSGP